MSFGKYAFALLVTGSFIACQKNDADRDPETPVEPVANNDVNTSESHHDSDRAASETTEPSTNARDAVPGAQGSAVASITQARCQREQRCENIGADKKYESMAKCVSEIRETWKDELNTRECRGGIVKKELDECLEEVRNENCNNPFDTLNRVLACREGDICKALD
ncbi:MAG TPA: DUF6184 family natural product biosynthesis lipoprotein [Polyangiaceae bacterium]|nr:DUF6184 family natural product biosynthesis lipoprotein [Polyangiaceae bacterium]